jgi:SAM-dependent methyltransferase
MKSTPEFEPEVMPVDRKAWRREIHRSNFMNSAHQLEDVESIPGVRSILVIGLGQGLDTAIFRWRGYEVTTFDIDPTFEPDHVGSVHQMGIFQDGQFDVVIASHVLEHFAVSWLDDALKEIARVGRHALIYLPLAGRKIQLRFLSGFVGVDRSLTIDVFNWFHRADGLSPRYRQGQHFWEVGLRGFRKKEILKRISRFFELRRVYRNPDWNESLNFVLDSRAHMG